MKRTETVVNENEMTKMEQLQVCEESKTSRQRLGLRDWEKRKFKIKKTEKDGNNENWN